MTAEPPFKRMYHIVVYDEYNCVIANYMSEKDYFLILKSKGEPFTFTLNHVALKPQRCKKQIVDFHYRDSDLCVMTRPYREVATKSYAWNFIK